MSLCKAYSVVEAVLVQLKNKQKYKSWSYISYIMLYNLRGAPFSSLIYKKILIQRAKIVVWKLVTSLETSLRALLAFTFFKFLTLLSNEVAIDFVVSVSYSVAKSVI